jgi:4-hydroxybenzoate polyprenyltransferase
MRKGGFTLRALFRAMRPKQWSKNVFVFVGMFFDGRIDFGRILATLAAFGLFCLLSSAVYLINDLSDLERDRLHPKKRHRPLASGALSPRVAWIAALIILGGGLPMSFALSPGFGGVALFYVALMLAYTFYLKHVVIIDVMVVAAGFVLRVLAGITVITVTRFSPWLFVCTTLLSLFIAINKRRHELLLLAEEANNHRTSLQEYTEAFLDHMTSLVTATLLTAYSFYTFSAPNLPANHAMMLTIPIALYGVFRYLYLVHAKGLGGDPEELVMEDKPLLLALILWVLTAGLVIYWPGSL